MARISTWLRSRLSFTALRAALPTSTLQMVWKAIVFFLLARPACTEARAQGRRRRTTGRRRVSQSADVHSLNAQEGQPPPPRPAADHPAAPVAGEEPKRL